MAYGFDADKSKTEVYKKDEVYSKDEVYRKDEVYSKAESNALIKTAIHTQSMPTLSANSSTGRVTVSPTKQNGYKLIGIIGARLYSDSENWDRIVNTEVGFTQLYVSDEANQKFVYVAKTGSTSMQSYWNTKVEFKLLYMKSNL